VGRSSEARRAARTRADGTLVPLQEQDRSRWNQKLIQEGLALVTNTLSRTQLGPYQLQAAIAAVHAEAARAEETDWRQILALYELLSAPRPTRSSRSTAQSPWRWSTARRPASTCCTRWTTTSAPPSTTASTPSAHLLEMTGERAAARDSYQAAARRTTSLPEQRYLEARAHRLIEKQ
jgi:predicted RNA polymerase sigma factor